MYLKFEFIQPGKVLYSLFFLVLIEQLFLQGKHLENLFVQCLIRTLVYIFFIMMNRHIIFLI